MPGASGGGEPGKGAGQLGKCSGGTGSTECSVSADDERPGGADGWVDAHSTSEQDQGIDTWTEGSGHPSRGLVTVSELRHSFEFYASRANRIDQA